MSAPKTLRILTLNTWKNDGDYPARLEAMGKGLLALAPDIILLQEVFRTADGMADTGRHLANALGLELIYAPARSKLRMWEGKPALTESGLAILVRGSSIKHHIMPLPGEESGGERIALLALLKVDDITLSIGCLHLSHLRNDDAGRREQLGAVLGNPFWSQKTMLRVLGGDFNAARGSTVFSELEDHPLFIISDVFAPSVTPPPTHPLPPIEGRGRAIDRLLILTPRPDEKPLMPVHAGLGLNVPVGGIWPGDHAAVYADFIIPTP